MTARSSSYSLSRTSSGSRVRPPATQTRSTGALLTSAVSGAEAALEELRALAYGIFPAVLTDFGLGPALETLADGSPLPVVVRAASGERYPPSVETTAYLAVAETIADAAERSATFVSVDAHPEAGRLVVTAEDDGEDGGTLGVELVDRVGALGGTLERRDGGLRVEIPCA